MTKSANGGSVVLQKVVKCYSLGKISPQRLVMIVFEQPGEIIINAHRRTERTIVQLNCATSLKNNRS